jgi:hypothetical protein
MVLPFSTWGIRTPWLRDQRIGGKQKSNFTYTFLFGANLPQPLLTQPTTSAPA